MPTRTFSAAGGNWNTTAAWVEAAVPTAADDVVATAGSGNVTITAAAVCRSMDLTGYVGILTHGAGIGLTIGDSTAGAGNVALRMAAGMTYTLGDVTTSMTFASTSATQQTITTAGKTLGSYLITGIGCSYILTDTNNARSVTLSAGTFNTNGQSATWTNFNYGNTTARTLTLGSSTIAIAPNNAWSLTAATNLTVTANTATLVLSGSTPTFNGGGVNWNGLSINCTGASSSPSFTNAGTLRNVTIANITLKSAVATLTASFTITGTLTISSDSAVNRLLVKSDIIGVSRTITAAAVSLSNVDFQDIVAAGAASPFTGTSIGNSLGNTNITFDAPVTQTHTASAGGSWSDVTKWTSRVPLPQDNVIVNGSTTGTILVDMPRPGATLNFTGFTGICNASTPYAVAGDLILGSGMTTSGAPAITLQGRSSTHIITSNGVTVTSPVTVQSVGGKYTLTDALTLSSSISVFAGTFDTGNQTFTTSLITTTTATVNLGSSIVNLSGTGFIANIASFTTINAGTSEIKVSTASASSRTFGGGGKIYNKLTYTIAGSTGVLVITGSNTFDTINFSDVTNARTLQFTAATVTTVLTAFNVRGTPGKLMSVQSATAATHTLTKASGIVGCDYLSLTNSIATGGAAWYAGSNSTNVSGNSGWLFSAAPTGAFLRLF